MARKAKGGGGSFREVREQHLPLFNPAFHRHDRGWPHPPPKAIEQAAKESYAKSPKSSWKTVGIVHFRHDEPDEPDANGGNATCH